jgi:hypothetical protein
VIGAAGFILYLLLLRPETVLAATVITALVRWHRSLEKG